ncbi:uncharacterized protein EAF01_003013 [Botrytis porri]|uniref:Uncharacterized protein n=1 Tax=Botrytis porri TaxID=87229 RepID=A0A4Z1KKZ0_9HELO|nr:uncharacterized protein EAF01_003013 [Botrytis porri]KAF7909295.1 hypothetical protein EAF01_003013 [Botrytis porri]TGO86741.1 hypothetical protein BPOR_0280g00100 [Botrytis porri]
MGLSNKGDSIVVFTLVTFFFIFLSIFLIYVPRRREMKTWFQRGVEITASIGRRNEVERDARASRFEDIEMGDMSGVMSANVRRGAVVVAMPKQFSCVNGRM